MRVVIGLALLRVKPLLLAMIVIDPHPGVELQHIQALLRALMGKLGKASTPVRITQRHHELLVGDVIGAQGIAHQNGHRQPGAAMSQYFIKPFTRVTDTRLIKHQSSRLIRWRRVRCCITLGYRQNGQTS